MRQTPLAKPKTQKSTTTPPITRGGRANSKESSPPVKTVKNKGKSKDDKPEEIKPAEMQKKIDEQLEFHMEKSEDDEDETTDEDEVETEILNEEEIKYMQGTKKYLLDSLAENAQTDFVRSKEVEVALKAIVYFQALQQRCRRIPVKTSAEIDSCMNIVIRSLLELESRYQASKARCDTMELYVKPPSRKEENNEDRQGQIENAKEQSQPRPPRGYADAVKMATSTVIVQSKEDRSAEDIEKQIKETVETCPEGIKRIKRIKNGIKLICEDEKEAQNIKEKIEGSEEASAAVKVITASVRKKKVIIFNVPRSETEDTIKKKLKKTLGLGKEYREEVITLHRQVGVRENAAHQPVLLPEPLADYLLRQKTICLGFRDCPIKAYINVTRCHKCLDYDHVAANCREAQRCTKCSGRHLYTECRSKKKCCMACLRYNEETRSWRRSPRNTEHEAYSAECETRHHLLRVRQLQSEKGMTTLATFQDIITGRVSIHTYGGKDRIFIRTKHDMEAARRNDQLRGLNHGSTR